MAIFPKLMYRFNSIFIKISANLFEEGPVQEWVIVRGERVNGEGEEEQIWSMYFILMYENMTMKSVEIVLRKGEEG
jgi:hypothetical protein